MVTFSPARGSPAGEVEVDGPQQTLDCAACPLARLLPQPASTARSRSSGRCTRGSRRDFAAQRVASWRTQRSAGRLGTALRWPRSLREPEPELSDDDLIDRLAERVAREAEAMSRACRWCVASVPAGEVFCSDYCRDRWHTALMPRSGDRHSGASRPAPHAAKKAMALGTKAAQAKRKWLKADPHRDLRRSARPGEPVNGQKSNGYVS
jgi:hypothetical protein